MLDPLPPQPRVGLVVGLLALGCLLASVLAAAVINRFF